MAGSTFVPLTPASQNLFITYYKALQNFQNITKGEMRDRFLNVDKNYQREVDSSEDQAESKAANASGDFTKFQNKVIPITKVQVETAVQYQVSVFLTGYPIFGVVSDPEFIDEALMIETKLAEDAKIGMWVRELTQFFRKGFKYNFSPLEVSWKEQKTLAVETNLDKSTSQGIPVEVLHSGNYIKSLDPYNVFLDTRVKPTEIHEKGEFVGYTEFKSRIELKQFIANLPDKIVSSIAPAFSSGSTSAITNSESTDGFYVPQINDNFASPQLWAGGTNWFTWAGISENRNKGMQYKDGYDVTTLYCRILPSEFSLSIPNKNTPQIYKLIIVNHEHIIYCEKQTNAHNYLPILIGQPLDDDLGYQTKSLADDAIPFQELATAYMNSIIASRRRSISDRALYDPSRVAPAHMNSANPSAKIPVRPSAYGKNVAEAVYQFPYRDDQAAGSIQQMQMLISMANNLAGQNQASQGQFVKGNKTLHEYESVMGNANGRDQMVSLLLEDQVFTPMKHILKLNILQYQGSTTIYNRDKNVSVEIDPVKLRKAIFDFEVTDGIIPASKVASTESLTVAMQILGSSPQIGSAYNISQLFSYLMKLQGAKITAFEKSPEQQAYEQAIGSWSSLIQLAIEKGNPDLAKQAGPQPLPEQFNYDPSKNKPAPAAAQSQQPQGQSNVIPTA